ncbi:MAG: NAD(P)-binding domain-containing protein [Bacteroidota bacterium]
MQISFIGSGNVARSLGHLFQAAGHQVLYSNPKPSPPQRSIPEAIQAGEVVCLAIPFTAIQSVLEKNKEALKGKILVDISNAIHLKDWSPLHLGPENSGAEEVARWAPQARVVKAFNTVFADVMQTDKQVFEGKALTAFIASDDAEAAKLVKQLADEAGFQGFLAGPLKNARYLEAMAHLNISIALAGGGTDAGFIYQQR